MIVSYLSTPGAVHPRRNASLDRVGVSATIIDALTCGVMRGRTAGLLQRLLHAGEHPLRSHPRRQRKVEKSISNRA
jgi:hypothetical protein